MRLERQDDYVLLEQNPQTAEPKLSEELREAFFPPWFFNALQTKMETEEIQEFEKIYFQQISSEIRKISDSPENCLDQGVPVGTSKVKMGNMSVPVREILLAVATHSVPIVVATSLLTTGPASLPLAAKAAAAFGSAAVTLTHLIKTYSDVELNVHTAVVAAMQPYRFKTLKADGVTADEVSKGFDENPKLLKPKNLKAVLDDMARKHMLLTSLNGGIEVFKPKF